MEQNIFKQLVEFGRESVSLEFKESRSWNDLKFKIIRCILAMSNTRGGGNLIIGINNNAELLGTTSEHLTTYDEEGIKDAVANYADPYADFSMEKVEFEDNIFIVFTVREFREIPVICKKDGDGLEKGIVYIRTRNRRPESTKVPDSVHMREVIDLAVDKGNERLRSRGWKHPATENAEEQFHSQISDLNI